MWKKQAGTCIFNEIKEYFCIQNMAERCRMYEV